MVNVVVAEEKCECEKQVCHYDCGLCGARFALKLLSSCAMLRLLLMRRIWAESASVEDRCASTGVECMELTLRCYF